MGNWYSARITSGYSNALDENMINGTPSLKKQGAIKKPAVVSALVRTCSINMIVYNFLLRVNSLILAESY